MVNLRVGTAGGKYWLLNYQRHRANGPAVTWPDSSVLWCWHDQEVTEYEHMMLVAQERSNG